MGLNELYDNCRKPLPKGLKQKKQLYEEFRKRKYDGEIGSFDYNVRKEYLLDLDIAIRVQIEKRLRIFTIITGFSAFFVVLDILLRIF